MMKLLQKLDSHKIILPHFISILLIIATSLLTTLLMFYIQPMGISEVFALFRSSNYITPLLNFLPVLLFMLLLFFITGNTMLAICSIGFLTTASSFVNRYKILLRNDPFFPYDFALAPEVLGIIKSFGATFIVLVILFVVFFIFFVFLILRFIRTRELSYKLRIPGALLVLLSIFILNRNLYCNTKMFQSLPVIGNIYNHKDVFNGRGFLYSFIYTFNTGKIEKPASYDKNVITGYIDEQPPMNGASLDNPQNPHLIVIMSEAFSEVADNPHLNFDGFTDPLHNYKEIKQNSIYGHIVVPNLGGGTGDTEFDFLTGINSRFFRGAPFAYRLITKNIPALPELLKQVGYQTEAIHPGFAWFYNRQNVYGYMGFEKFYDRSYFDPADEKKGGYVNEPACFDRIIAQFENRASDAPLFSFTVTIQNHGPFENKYGVATNFNTDLSLDYREVNAMSNYSANFDTSLNLDSRDINAMSNYFEGLKDADIELRRIVDYLEKQDEPVVLVFFGDHLPAFASPAAFTALYGKDASGGLEDRTRLYAPPFLIWQNKAAKESTSIEENMEALYGGENPYISSFYLGGLLLELLDLQGLSSFFDYANGLRAQYPVVLENEYFDGQRQLGIIEEDDALVFLKNWNYYQLFE